MADSDFTLRSLCWLTATALLMLPGSVVRAQDDASITVRQLEDELARRDALIIDLLNRVRALERVRSARQWRPEADAAEGETPSTVDVADREEHGSANGDFEIDALAAERALERGLVREGARLLGPGQLEVEPAFATSLRNAHFATTLVSGDDNLVGEISQTYEALERRANLRVGLPWESQLEVGLPYLTVKQQTETGVDGSLPSIREESGSGFGDATISLSKAIAAEAGARPNLIARLAWLSGSGDWRDGTVVLGGGYSGFSGSLSAYWRRDPVVLLLSGGYTHYDENSALRPGDRLGVSFGLGLAASPDTALFFSLNQTYADEFERGGIKLPGTDSIGSTLDLAVSTTLTGRLLLRGYAAAGLTEESPDYSFGVSLSARLNMR